MGTSARERALVATRGAAEDEQDEPNIGRTVSSEDQFAWAPAADEVRVAAFGSQLVARSGFHACVSLDDCALIAGALREPDLALIIDSMALDVTRKLDVTKMSDCAQRVYSTENAGGSSELSEAFSMELLSSVLGAKLDKTELELQYFTGTEHRSKITDFSVVVDEQVIGVSVTRACCRWPHVSGAFGIEDAVRLLTKKLDGVVESTKHVSNASWTKQLLHVFVPDEAVLSLLREAYDMVGAHLRANTVVVLTLCTGPHCSEVFKRATTSTGMPLKKKARVGLGMKTAEHLQHLLESDPCRSVSLSVSV